MTTHTSSNGQRQASDRAVSTFELIGRHGQETRELNSDLKEAIAACGDDAEQIRECRQFYDRRFEELAQRQEAERKTVELDRLGNLPAVVPSLVPARQASPQLAAETMQKLVTASDLSGLSPVQKVEYYRAFCRSLGLNELTKPVDLVRFQDGSGAAKEILYPNATGANQLAQLHRVSTKIVKREIIDGLYIVTARAVDVHGREDERSGIVPLTREDGKWEKVTDRNGNVVTKADGKPKFRWAGNGRFLPLGPLERANAMKKSETQAVRRAKLGLIGFGAAFDDVAAASEQPYDFRIDEVPVDVDRVDDGVFETDGRVVEVAADGELTVDPETGEILDEPEDQPERVPLVSQQQLTKIFALASSIGMDRDDAKALIHDSYGVTSSKNLTVDQASDLIGKLKFAEKQQHTQAAEPAAADAAEPAEVGAG